MTKIFVSAGTPANDSQKAFRDAVIRAIELAGLSPRLMSANDWDYKNPLRGVRRAMQECRGALVIAYARYQFDSGLELREGGNRTLEMVAFPTAWNQIEAAMAYERGLPLLVVAQKGLRQDALLESTSDIRPLWTDLDSMVAQSAGFLGYLRSWKLDIDALVSAEETATRDRVRASHEFTIAEIFSSLPWHQVVAFLVTLIGVLLAAVTIGYRLGKGQWPLG